jgi:hypothetical protein
VTKEHKWIKNIPTPDALNWHCKYRILADRALITPPSTNGTSTTAFDIGYIELQVENYGFDFDVNIIVQPFGKYLDFN